MCFGKSTFPFETRGDGDLPCFGERAEFVPSFGIVHALACVNNRPFGSGEYGSSLVGGNWIGPGSRRKGRCVDPFLGNIFSKKIDGNFDQNRSGTSVS